MVKQTSATLVQLLLLLPLSAFANANADATNPPVRDPICVDISTSISSASAVFYAGDPLYEKGIFHWTNASIQRSNCVVEAGTPQDVGIILGIVAKNKTPFAVKGGGHATNPGFSSTPGVHISMYRFNEVNYDNTTQTAEIGAGLIWDTVYATLVPLGVNVVGGRMSGVGVGGLLLGGGYSYKTNQFGLAIDNILAYELVKPDGKVVTVTNSSDPELFFGLKGGFNNFGIVTKFTLKTHPQGPIWGGAITYDQQFFPDVATAVANFQAKVEDPKAALELAYTFVPSTGQTEATVMVFYDAVNPASGIFEDLLAIPTISSSVASTDYVTMITSDPIVNATQGQRTVFNANSVVEFTPALADVIINETSFWGTALADKSATSLSIVSELFLPSIYSHNPDATAYPPIRTIGYSPYVTLYSWTDPQFDADFASAAEATTAQILSAAVAEGQTFDAEAPLYPNYAIGNTPLERIYGDNLPRLRALKARIDPTNIMGLAGGYKF